MVEISKAWTVTASYNDPRKPNHNEVRVVFSGPEISRARDALRAALVKMDEGFALSVAHEQNVHPSLVEARREYLTAYRKLDAAYQTWVTSAETAIDGLRYWVDRATESEARAAALDDRLEVALKNQIRRKGRRR